VVPAASPGEEAKAHLPLVAGEASGARAGQKTPLEAADARPRSAPRALDGVDVRGGGRRGGWASEGGSGSSAATPRAHARGAFGSGGVSGGGGGGDGLAARAWRVLVREWWVLWDVATLILLVWRAAGALDSLAQPRGLAALP
jgi:hypothetical protein